MERTTEMNASLTSSLNQELNADTPANKFLRIAATEGQVDDLTEALCDGALVDACDKQGNTALMLAAEHGHLGCVKKLLLKGASIDQVNQQGRTALHAACAAGQVEVVTFLVKWEADLAIKDLEGKLAIDLARKHHHDACVKILEKQLHSVTKLISASVAQDAPTQVVSTTVVEKIPVAPKDNMVQATTETTKLPATAAAKQASEVKAESIKPILPVSRPGLVSNSNHLSQTVKPLDASQTATVSKESSPTVGRGVGAKPLPLAPKMHPSVPVAKSAPVSQTKLSVANKSAPIVAHPVQSKETTALVKDKVDVKAPKPTLTTSTVSQGQVEQKITAPQPRVDITPNASLRVSVRLSTSQANYFEQAVNYYKQGKLTEAIDAFSLAIEQNPNHALAYLYRGNIYVNQKQFEKAQADFEKAFSLDAKLDGKQRTFARLYREQGKYEAALKAYGEALTANAKDAATLCGRAKTYQLMNNIPAATADVEASLTLNPQLPEAIALQKELASADKNPASSKITTTTQSVVPVKTISSTIVANQPLDTNKEKLKTDSEPQIKQSATVNTSQISTDKPVISAQTPTINEITPVTQVNAAPIAQTVPIPSQPITASTNSIIAGQTQNPAYPIGQLPVSQTVVPLIGATSQTQPPHYAVPTFPTPSNAPMANVAPVYITPTASDSSQPVPYQGHTGLSASGVMTNSVTPPLHLPLMPYSNTSIPANYSAPQIQTVPILTTQPVPSSVYYPPAKSQTTLVVGLGSKKDALDKKGKGNKPKKLKKSKGDLHKACERGQLEKIKYYINQGYDLNEKYVPGKYETNWYTPLYLAVRSKQLEAVKLLLQAGVDVNLGSDFINRIDTGYNILVEDYTSHKTPLTLACDDISEAIIIEILSTRKEARISNFKGTILHYGLIFKKDFSEAFIETMVKIGIDINDTSCYGSTVFELACGNSGELSFIKQLIRLGADIKRSNAQGFNTNLIALCGRKDFSLELFNLLYQAGVPLYCATSSGTATALHSACRNGVLQTVELILPLLPKDIINALDHEGKSALECACTNINNQNTAIVKVLLQYGIDPRPVIQSKNFTSFNLEIKELLYQAVMQFDSHYFIRMSEKITQRVILLFNNTNQGYPLYPQQAQQIQWCIANGLASKPLQLLRYDSNNDSEEVVALRRSLADKIYEELKLYIQPNMPFDSAAITESVKQIFVLWNKDAKEKSEAENLRKQLSLEQQRNANLRQELTENRNSFFTQQSSAPQNNNNQPNKGPSNTQLANTAIKTTGKLFDFVQNFI